MEKKLHWFCLTFQETVGNKTVFVSVHLGLNDKKISNSLIKKSKKDSGMSEDAVILACSYLGHMTADEFYGEEREK